MSVPEVIFLPVKQRLVIPLRRTRLSIILSGNYRFEIDWYQYHWSLLSKEGFELSLKSAVAKTVGIV
jgi:hypothetical protein